MSEVQEVLVIKVLIPQVSVATFAEEPLGFMFQILTLESNVWVIFITAIAVIEVWLFLVEINVFPINGLQLTLVADNQYIFLLDETQFLSCLW